MKLSIIIPAYNEEKRIVPVLEDYYKLFTKELGSEFEIIIICNNCSDKTYEVSANYCKDKDNMDTINISYYTGKGGAVLRGFEIAEGDLIGFTDADESVSAKEYLKLYQNIRNNDGVIGSRKMEGSIIYPERSKFNQISSKVFNTLVRTLYGLKYKDTQCGAKIFTKELAKEFTLKTQTNGWVFDVELLYICKKQNKSILEYPITWKQVEGSHLFEGVKK